MAEKEYRITVKKITKNKGYLDAVSLYQEEITLEELKYLLQTVEPKKPE